MKILKSVSMTPQMIKNVQKYADTYYLGNFSMAIEMLLILAFGKGEQNE